MTHDTTESIPIYQTATESYHREQRRRQTDRLRRVDGWRRDFLRALALVAGLGLVLGLALGAVGCSSLSPETAEALQAGWAANAHDARDPALSDKERGKGALNARLLLRIAAETKTPLPAADEAERLAGGGR